VRVPLTSRTTMDGARLGAMPWGNASECGRK
jgi:hypothetical protein